MAISATNVKDLRAMTGAGMLDCKNALTEADGNTEKAVEILRKKGLSKAAKKAGRIAAEGIVGSYIHAEGSIGVMAEINCETDFVAKTEDFQNFVKDICMHIAACKPSYLCQEEVPADVLAKEKEIAIEEAKASGKPEKVLEKIAEGKVKKFFIETCLLDQAFVKDTDKSINDIVTEKIAKIGENIKIRRFTRFELGEGIEKKQENFAEEVAATISAS